MVVSFFLETNSLCLELVTCIIEELGKKEWLDMVISQFFIAVTIFENISLKVERIILPMFPETTINGRLPTIAGQ